MCGLVNKNESNLLQISDKNSIFVSDKRYIKMLNLKIIVYGKKIQ